MGIAAPIIKTITFATRELLEAVQPLPAGMRGGVWDLTGDPVGVELAEVDAVVLPYMGMDPGWRAALRRTPQLKLVQTQSTGYEGILEAVGPEVAVASAAGVHAASTAELALALILASLRGLDVAARDQPASTWRNVRRPSLADRKVLLVGVGGIGREIARRLEPFDVALTRVGSRAREDVRGASTVPTS